MATTKFDFLSDDLKDARSEIVQFAKAAARAGSFDLAAANIAGARDAAEAAAEMAEEAEVAEVAPPAGDGEGGGARS